MKNIVVATDFSERSDRAMRRAIILAKTRGANLSLIHVVDDDQPRRIIEAGRAAATSLLDEHVQAIRTIDGVECRGEVITGDPFEGIVRAARDFDADLVILGPHRGEKLKDIFLGTTAERTIRTSSIPVLMAAGVPARPYRHVMIAADLSASSADAIVTAMRLGLTGDVIVTVVHVFDAMGTNLMSRASLTDEQIKSYVADQRARADAELKTFLASTRLVPNSRLLKLSDRSADSLIVAAAHEADADLIIVGTHGRTGITKLLLGSVAEGVLRHASCDVLAVPPGAH